MERTKNTAQPAPDSSVGLMERSRAAPTKPRVLVPRPEPPRPPPQDRQLAGGRLPRAPSETNGPRFVEFSDTRRRGLPLRIQISDTCCWERTGGRGSPGWPAGKSTEQHIDGSSELGRTSIPFGIRVASEATVKTPNQHSAGGCFQQSDPSVPFDHGQDGLPYSVVLAFRKARHHRQSMLQEGQPIVHLQSRHPGKQT